MTSLIFTQYLLDAADLAVGEADLDAVGVGGGVGEDIFDGADGAAAGALVLFENDRDLYAGADVFALAVGHLGILEDAAEQHKLADVVSVMVGDEHRFA